MKSNLSVHVTLGANNSEWKCAKANQQRAVNSRVNFLEKSFLLTYFCFDLIDMYQLLYEYCYLNIYRKNYIL